MIISLLHIVRSKESINYFKYRVILFLIGFLLIILSESSLKIIEDDIISNIKLNHDDTLEVVSDKWDWRKSNLEGHFFF